ncbi:MAG: uracil phosphoribosyltransferase [Bacteroidota bacterium]|nr:uracil phosphoribosyltransferase [Bacteroidota bacterium]MDP3146573.1 uracil phosphoribosyltransferase [Bacteroidota bacterium]MDP3556791.1 uracil phosphoribosyltransferase [Bacteroidota bacterium]
MIHNLALQNSIFNQYILELRDIEIQKDSMRFRRNLERMGEIFAYEISKTLDYNSIQTTTSLGVAETKQLAHQPVIGTILRAGLPLHLGLLNYFDKAQNAFISAYRRHHKNNTFEIIVEYIACPDLTDKTLILCDPMLATGGSIVLTYKALLAKGSPKHTHIVVAVASQQGIDYLKAHMPNTNYTLWCGAIDEELTAQSYIVPGLGDAGDLAFGSKL